MSFVKILLSVPDSAATMKDTLQLVAAANQVDDEGLVKLIGDMVDGSQVAYTKISTGAVQATDAVTFSSFVEDDTVTVNGVVFVGKNSPSTSLQFGIGLDDAATALNFATKINASAVAKIVGVVSASAASTVVTLTAVQPGLAGNVLTLAISAHGSVTDAYFAGGSDGSQVAVNYGAAS